MNQKPKKYEIQYYAHSSGDIRRQVKAIEKVYLVYTTANGSGLAHCCLAPGESWPEGAEELERVFDTEEELLAFMKE